MRVHLFARPQNTLQERPAHFALPRLVKLAVEDRLAKWLDEKHRSAQLTTNMTWAAIKERYRAPKGPSVVVVPRLKPPGYVIPAFAASYPPRNYESDGAAKQRRLWMRAERF